MELLFQPPFPLKNYNIRATSEPPRPTTHKHSLTLRLLCGDRSQTQTHRLIVHTYINQHCGVVYRQEASGVLPPQGNTAAPALFQLSSCTEQM